MKWAKKAKRTPLMTSLTKKTQNQKFFSLHAQRLSGSFEGLNSSLAQSAVEIHPCKITWKLLVLASKQARCEGVKNQNPTPPKKFTPYASSTLVIIFEKEG